MAAYVLGEIIWVIEQRGRVVWTREGKRGARGRSKYEELASNDAARERIDAMIGERVAQGFALIDGSRSIDAPLYGVAAGAKKKKAARMGLDVAELHAKLAKLSGDTPRAWLDRFLDVTKTACTQRLLRLSFSVDEDGSHVELTAVFGKGQGSNPDAYDEDGYIVRLETPPLARDDLEDGVDLDVFADELGRISQTNMVATFRRAVEDLASFAEIRDARVTSAKVDRVA